ncbi:hypothetical protein [Moritella viscosa]|uniref:Penicillin-binding protein 1A-Penicillin-insensitive transglycosylase-Peptidoglycan TGase-Penicillin-sensitive transpeptidase-DD-transpeptidase n=1 Tax=Moritella viscosa TaxID=80854 RepID=A0ABY1HIK8_9GAMM|nr:hypothetical protein [Moritella viscosa]SGZ00571.1 Penicillin-binding protein 1A-Penicillin-insensitive transglycosylase-Peptidoglycan TGase-Penicillin-sensitive transpeptidase-DD-transpeptidase [Moritella viscosa]
MKIKWQGIDIKRASHAFLVATKAGQTSLCGRETLTTGYVSASPEITSCGSCVKKAKKLGLMD